MSPFLSGATGDPINVQRRMAQQANRGVAPAEELYRDFRHDGGPLTISAAEIKRAVIAASGEPSRSLKGKRNAGGGPMDFGDADPSNIGQLMALGNLIGKYDYTDNTTWQRWILSRQGGSEFDPYLALLEDTDMIPRTRALDVLIGGITIAATAGANFRITAPFVPGSYDLFGEVVQTEGGKAAQAITSITRASTTATVTTTAPHGLQTGDVVAITGAVETEYNVNAVITRTGASTFTYTVSGTPSSPATGTPVFATNGLSITGITQTAGTATATTAAAHGLATGDTVRVSGAGQAGYNIDATVTVTGANTFTYPVASATVTPATGTLVFESLSATLPQVSNTWAGNWEPDDEDWDIYVELVSFDGVRTWTVRAKVSAAETFASTFTAKVGLDSAGNPIRTRMVDQDGAGIGPWSEQIRWHMPAGGDYRIGNVYRIPNRRGARWVQELAAERPISSVALAAFVAAAIGEDLEEIRFEGGANVTVQRTTTARPDTPGRQGATTTRSGEMGSTVTLTREISDLRMQKAMHEGTPMPLVLDARADVFIGASGQAYRVLVVMPSCTVYGDLYGVGVGATNKDEAPRFVPGVPDDPFTYDGMTFTSALTVVIDTDITEADVFGA